MNAALVNTKAVRNRRDVSHLKTLSDVVSDAQRLARAEQELRLRALGNWSLGQACNHLAVWIEFAYDGVPPPAPPFILKLIGKLLKGMFIRGNMPAGVRMGGVEGGTHGCEPTVTDKGLARLIAAAERLQREVPTLPNPVFGTLTHEEWIALHVNHAKLHLSFFAI